MNAPQSTPHVLLVDDEPRALAAAKRILEPRFHVSTVQSAGDAMAALLYAEPFAFIIADLALPDMNGVQLLVKVRELSPSTVRMLLTGTANLDDAVLAINNGNVFRFILKPYLPETLLVQAEAAAEHHRLLIAERELLERTLHGAIKVLTNLLALGSPAAFGRGVRLSRHAADIAAALSLPNRWEIEAAAMLSQIGSVILSADLVDRMQRGATLTDAEQSLVDRIPAIENELLTPIPRLEGVRCMLQEQSVRYDGHGHLLGLKGNALSVGGRILKILTDFDTLDCQGRPLIAALKEMEGRIGWYDPKLLQSFAEIVGQSGLGLITRTILLCDVQHGMVFGESVSTANGLLLIARGQDVTAGLLGRIHGHWKEFAKTLSVRMILPED